MSFNRKFIPNVWESQQPVQPRLPFANNHPNFYGNQNLLNCPRFFSQVNQQQQMKIRPLLSLAVQQQNDHTPGQYRKFNNHQQDFHQHRNKNRPAPANRFDGHQLKWNKDNRREDFRNRDIRINDSYDCNSNRSESLDRSFDRDLHLSNCPPRHKSLVEELKAVQSSLKKDGHNYDGSRDELDTICANKATEVSKKLMNQLKTMNKDGVRDLINNPKQPYKKKVLNLQARLKLREEMRKRLKKLGTEGDPNDVSLDADMSIDYEKLPEALIAQIDKTIDLNLLDDMNFSHDMEDMSDDKDIEVVKQNLGSDFLMGSETLLMNGFSLLAEVEGDEKSLLDERIPNIPPLPKDNRQKPPSPPPEHTVRPVNKLIQNASFSRCDNDKPWPQAMELKSSYSSHDRINTNDWNIECVKNPDPPSSVYETQTVFKAENNFCASTSKAVQSNEVKEPQSCASPSKEPVKNGSVPAQNEEAIVQPKDNQAPPDSNENNSQKPQDSKRRANETYGEYRRRLQKTSRQQKDWDGNGSSRSDFNQKKPVQDWDGDGKAPATNKADGSNWKIGRDSGPSNRRRKSRLDMAHTSNARDLSRNFQRNTSRDTNNSWDIIKPESSEKTSEGLNYRFHSENHSQEPDLDRLNSILHPRPLQFKGSFNKRTHTSDCNQRNPSKDRPGRRSRSKSIDRFGRRSMSRNRTPTYSENSDSKLLQLPGDARPCYHILQKIMELDEEINKIHEKVHGIDKVISSLQLERVGYQKSFTRLQHDRKVLFDNLLKRAVNEEISESVKTEKQSVSSPAPAVPQKSQISKRQQETADKKRKFAEEPSADEPKAKKPARAEKIPDPEPTAASLQQKKQEKQEEELKKMLQERKSLKQLRMDRELHEEVERIKASLTADPITIKQEPLEKSKSNKLSMSDQQKSRGQKHNGKSSHNSYSVSTANKSLKKSQTLFKSSDILHVSNYELKDLNFKLRKILLAKSLCDQFMLHGTIEIDIDDWNQWSRQVKTESNTKPKEATSIELTIETEDLHAYPENSNNDSLAKDDFETNQLTPSALQLTDEDSMLIELQNILDYSEWTGTFTAHDQPIVHLQNINGKYVICAAEDGKVFKYQLSDGKLAAVFSKHTEICNSFLYIEKDGSTCNHHSIISVSSDGFLHRFKFKNFQLSGSQCFNEPLQVIEQSKTSIYVGAKSGRIFRLKADLSSCDDEPLCDLGSLILCLRAAKEGSRNILLVSSRSNAIQIRDANDGLLLRMLSHDLTGVSIYDMLIEGSTIYCGSNKSEIFSVDFTTGAVTKSRPCGAGTICVKLYKNYLIAACYDGNIYVFDTTSDDDAVNITGPGNMLLSMDLWNDKIIASTKDKTLKIINIPGS